MAFRTLHRCRPIPAVVLAVAGAIAFSPPVAGQAAASFEPAPARAYDFPLTIESIMRGPELVGQSPAGIRWSDDGRWVYFRWRPGGAEWWEERELYRVPAEGGDPERLDEETADRLAPVLARGDVSPDGRYRVTSADGDLHLIERATGEIRQLTDTDEREFVPSFSGDGESVHFRRGRNLYAFDLEDDAIRQLTYVAEGPEEGEEEAEGHRAFLEEQQLELFEHLRVRERRRARDSARAERLDDEPEPLHLARGERVSSLDAEPGGRYVVVTATAGATGAERTDIPRWITRSGYTENTEMRAKVGDEQSTSRLGLIEAETGDVTWLDLSASPEGSESGGTDESEEEAAGTGPLAVASFVGWNDSGSHGLVFAVDADYKTWRLYALDGATRELTLLDRHRDEAWVGGPCFGFGGASCIGWFPDDGEGLPRAWYVSEETGFAHLYVIDADGGNRRALTGGEWEVLNARIPEGWDAFLLHTSEVSP
ncbi:MAG: DPP IV N-terminal domain-containing protein, partial [Gemmatimonadota bacterium]|nr:DPP IV N-terminal domain-containing protein [Gemmatimonadota bacterium]